MAPVDELRSEKLVELTRTRFDPELSDTELKILCDSAAWIAPLDPEESDSRPEVRAEFVRWLVTDQEAATLVDPRGVIVRGVTIPANLDLQRCRLHVSLSFSRCDFRDKIDLQFAEAPALYFSGCSLDKGIEADWASVSGSVMLDEVTSAGRVGFALARIGGELSCLGSKIIGEDASLTAQLAEVRGGIRLTEGFECSGEVTLNHAYLGRRLDCSGAKLGCSNVALKARSGLINL